MELGEVGLEELAGPVGGGDAALYQEVGEDLVDAQLRGEGADQSRVALLFNYPFFSIDMSANLQNLSNGTEVV